LVLFALSLYDAMISNSMVELPYHAVKSAPDALIFQNRPPMH
jgi:hypothetical protein